MTNKIIGYHGAGTTFQRFKCPAYFAEDAKIAEFFARQNESPKLLRCSLKFNNPLIVNLDGQSWGGFWLRDSNMQNECIKFIANGDIEEENYFNEEGLTIGFLADYAEAFGYDGIIAHGCREENNSVGTQYVVFQPDNIQILKSMQIHEELGQTHEAPELGEELELD